MYEAQIQTVIESIPEDVLGKRRFVEHFFYAPESVTKEVAERKLRKICSKIKDLYDNASFRLDLEGGSLIVTLDSVIDQDSLVKLYTKLKEVAEHVTVEYDGFGVIIDELASEVPPFEPFENYFLPRSYIRLLLGNGKFGYLLFLGGDAKTGYFYECLSTSNTGDISIDELDNSPRLYKQFVQGVFDPLRCEMIGRSLAYLNECSACFRVLKGFPSPEEIESIYKKYGLSSKDNEGNWLQLLSKVVASDGKDFFCQPSYRYCVTIDKLGVAKWSELIPIESGEIFSSMPFGTFLGYENFNEALTGGLDELSLTDHTSGILA